MTKAVYETPELNEIGSFETLTQGRSSGNNLDAAFPANAPFSALTFS